MTIFDQIKDDKRPRLLRFCGCNATLDEADIVLFGAGFDSSSSYQPGSRFAPGDMRQDSWALETWSPSLKLDLEKSKIADAGDLELPFADIKASLEQVEAVFSAIITADKIPFMIGGEHSLSLAGVRALKQQYDDLHLLHFDAHTDLRQDYLGVKFSHASVIRRCFEILGKNRIHSLAVRSGLQEEFVFAANNLDFHPGNFKDIDQVIKNIGDAPLYLTVDLDVLDPAYLAATGTAEAGGVSVNELLNAIYKLKNLNIVAADLMELAPRLDPSRASTAVACKILRELLLTISAS